MPTYGFTGTVDDLQFARMMALQGGRVSVEAPTHWAPTATANAREVSFAAGSGWLPGLRHETAGATLVANAINSSGSTRYDLIVARANWTAKTVTFTSITGTPGAGVPPGISKTMLTTGDVYDMPLVVCRTISGGGAYTAGTDLFDVRPYGSLGQLVVTDGTYLANVHDLVPGQRWKANNTGVTYTVNSAGTLVPEVSVGGKWIQLNNQSIPNATLTKVKFDGTPVKTHPEISVSGTGNTDFAFQRTGWWRCDAFARISGDGGVERSLQVVVNGVVEGAQNQPDSLGCTPQVSALFYVTTVGHSGSIQVYHDFGSNLSTTASATKVSWIWVGP